MPLEEDPQFSVFNEPHLNQGKSQGDPSEERARLRIERERNHQTEDERVEFSVWDEPGVSKELSGEAPPEALTYAKWLQRRMSQTSGLKTWLVTLGLSLAAGPWAVFGALMNGGQGAFAIVMLVVIAPLTEEVMKIAASLWVVEKRPHLFNSAIQILLCGLASGLAFAAIENILYLNVYVSDPSPLLATWRWTVCVALHSGCTLLASVGLVRIWSDTTTNLVRPRLSLGGPYLVAAVIMHGVYNASAIVIERFIDFSNSP